MIALGIQSPAASSPPEPPGLVRAATADEDGQPAASPDGPVGEAVDPTPIDYGLLREDLLSKFPTFAGLFNNGDGSITLLTTAEPTDDLTGFVRHRLQSPVVTTEAIYDRRAVSLADLRLLKSRVEADEKALGEAGLVLTGVGIDDKNNSVVVGMSSSLSDGEAILRQRYGDAPLDVMAWTLVEQADRYNDSPPWNGGDQIVGPPCCPPPYQNQPQVCTTGFGVHDIFGNRYVTTAGHCDTGFASDRRFWNTNALYPLRTSARLVGSVSGTVWNGDETGYDVDTQKLATPRGSSRYIWTQSATRRTIGAAIGVAQFDSTCIEGAITRGSCGFVFLADWKAGAAQYLVEITNGNPTAIGDSGAPSWVDNSGYGPLAQGTHVGGCQGCSSIFAAEMKINMVLYFNGVGLNTPGDP